MSVGFVGTVAGLGILWTAESRLLFRQRSGSPQTAVGVGLKEVKGSSRAAALAVDQTADASARRAVDDVIAQHPFPDRLTWLLVGSDARAGEPARADAIVIARVNPSRGRVFLLSVPRDLRARVQGHGLTKINHALAYGQLPLLRKTVFDVTGIGIDHALRVDFMGFSMLIDALGGVTVYVEKPLRYDDPGDHTHICLSAGWHRLTGKQALDYVRFRHDALADTGRMMRQQKLLKALSRGSVPPRRWWAVSAAILQMPRHLETDASVWDLLALLGRLSLKGQVTVQTHVLSGVNRVDPADGLWYFYVNARDLALARAEIAKFDLEK